MSHPEPIALIGLACRFPGSASSPERFWQNLLAGLDGIVEVPKSRWELRSFYDPEGKRPGKARVKKGGFLNENIFLFDPLFFGISPREAYAMDPQQRYLLEVTWEALEDAGIPPSRLRRGRVGVFIGGFCLDNLLIQLDRANRENVDSSTATSGTMTMLANRISHLFDFRGPSLTVDTACSSSLVAAHLACQSLRSGESELAVVGGVNLMLRPEMPLVMSKGQFLSSHGYCKMFDADASGYTRGEGAGVVILKPYRRALADGDSIYALIRESGSNQDGHTQGISFPNVESQKALLRDVYERAGVEPREVSYVEAHGTGTLAGDSAEAAALDEVLSDGRLRGERLLVGSVKTGIGHLEAAAGVAGLIKTALCLSRRKIPANLHFETPNPKIPFERMCLEVPTAPVEWEPHGKRYAAINSFGYGGSNAHLLLEEHLVVAPEEPAAPPSAAQPFLFTLSTRDEHALRELAGRYAQLLEHEGGTLALDDLLHSTYYRRDHLSCRLTIVAQSVEEVQRKLATFRRGEPDPDVLSGTLRQPPARGPVFVFTGMGPQWARMGAELYESEPIFRETVDRCARAFAELTGWQVRDELFRDEAESRMADTVVAQTANFVLQVALVELLREKGVTPAAVVGHSVGEVAAAYAAGVLTLEDAVRVSYHRGHLQKSTAGRSGMLALALSQREAHELLQGNAAVEIAAINAPRSVTLSGDPEELARLAAWAEGRAIFSRTLDVEVAYHSRQMEAIRPALREALAELDPRDANLPLYSTVTAGLHAGERLDVGYWWRNVREPVLFEATIRALLADGYTHFIEVGPHPVLRPALAEIFGDARAPAVSLQTLNRRTPERATFYRSLAEYHLAGLSLDWSAFLGGRGRYVKLPHYPWQKEVYWQESRWTREHRLGSGGPDCFFEEVYAPQPSWRVDFSPQFFPYLHDHRVQGEVVFPAAGFIEIGLHLHQRLLGEPSFVLENLRFFGMLADDASADPTLQTTWDPKTRTYAVHSSRTSNENHWRLHATGRLLDGCSPSARPAFDAASFICAAQQHIPGSAHYAEMERRGLTYGPAFRGIRDLWINQRKILAAVRSPEGLETDASPFHPALLDTAFQTLILLVGQPGTFVPVAVDRLTYMGRPGPTFYCLGELLREGRDYVVGTVELLAEGGSPIGRIEGLRCRLVGRRAQEPAAPQRYAFRWMEKSVDGAPPAAEGAVLVLACPEDPQGEALAGALRQAGSSVCTGNLERKALSGLIGRALEAGTRRIVCCVPNRAGGGGDQLAREIVRFSSLVADLVRVLAGRQESLRLAFAGSGAQAVLPGDAVDNPLLGALWELGQVIANEHPHISCRMIDAGREDTPWRRIAADLFGDAEVVDVAYRGDRSFVRRLVPLDARDEDPAALVDCARVPVALELPTPGDLTGLRYRQVARELPQAGEIEINVKATSLNFKDVLKVYGQLDPFVTESTYCGDGIGMEASGVITRVGPGEEELRVGDAVVAPVQGGAFRSYARVESRLAIRKPAALSFAEAPVLIGFLAAYYGLVESARLQRGEKVLVHNAAGGVGLAALQLAGLLGAEVYATAGTQEKREFLRAQGVARIYDSRSLAFAEAILRDTGGYGVDVVLSALAEPALSQSFELLAPYGRFIEIGKKEIAENSGLPLRAFNRNLSFTAIDMDRMTAERPALVRRLLDDLLRLFEEGALGPLHTRIFAAAQTADAFRFMAMGSHIGKIAVSFEGDVPALPALGTAGASGALRGTYLVTGGTGGFGLEVARWLAGRGVQRLVLASRGGVRGPAEQQAIAALRQSGVQVEVERLDVTDGEQLSALVRRIGAEGPPLRGVVHSAMVLDDGVLVDLTEERWARVILPKVAGALHLHEATLNEELDHFLLFSSVSAMIGNSGQGNYVVANGFLDHFAAWRRARGLPCTSVNWGPLAGAGVVERSRELLEYFALQGIAALDLEEALAHLGWVLEQRPVQVGVFSVEWERWARAFPDAARSSRFRELATQGEPRSGLRLALVEELLTLDAAGRSQRIAATLKGIISHTLKLPVERISEQEPLANLGVDSLTTVELVVGIERETGVQLATMEIFKGSTVTQLAAKILDALLGDERPALDALDSLSEEELDALIRSTEASLG